jgi:uncharacterized protein (DUF2267 family)
MSWIYAIEEECGWEEDDQKQAFMALRAVLQELRSLLPLESAIHLSAQLPLIIRGLFFENWSTHTDQFKIRKKEDFLVAIATKLFPYPGTNAETATKGILNVIRNKISEGEWDKIMAVLPTDLKELFQ